MTQPPVAIMQYAWIGASLSILVAVGLLVWLIRRGRKGKSKRSKRKAIKQAEKETKKLEKKKAKKETKKNAKREAKKQVLKRKKHKKKSKNKRLKNKGVYVAKVQSPISVTTEKVQEQTKQDLQIVQERQAMHRLRTVQYAHMQQEIQRIKRQGAQTQQIQEERVQAPLMLQFYKLNTLGQKEEQISLVLQEPLTVGRNPDTHDWTIEGDWTVSGNHCKLYQEWHHVYVQDLDSTNGTYINEHRVYGTMELKNKDHLRMGDSIYSVTIKDL